MISSCFHPHHWAEQTFGTVDLGDRRRTRRAISMAACIMRRPSASLPVQMRILPALKAAYRLLERDVVTQQALSSPHWYQTRHQAHRQPLVLLIQDTTEVDYTPHPATTGLGPIGDNRGRGYLLQTVLAVVPTPRQVLGVAYQEPFLRQPAPDHKVGAAKRRTRERESQVWLRAVQAVGTVPPESTWVHVGDRYADIFDFMEACQQQGGHFLVRAAQERRVQTDDTTVTYLLTFARSLPALDQQAMAIPARRGHKARQTVVSIAFQAILLLPLLGVGFYI